MQTTTKTKRMFGRNVHSVKTSRCRLQWPRLLYAAVRLPCQSASPQYAHRWVDAVNGCFHLTSTHSLLRNHLREALKLQSGSLRKYLRKNNWELEIRGNTNDKLNWLLWEFDVGETFFFLMVIKYVLFFPTESQISNFTGVFQESCGQTCTRNLGPNGRNEHIYV